MTGNTISTPVVVIGAGIGGISTAIALQTQLGLYDYEIYEMADGVGGTWRENTYPGCACDVPSHWYSLSTEPNPDWSQIFAGHEEIKHYWEGIVTKHKIASRIRFNTEVLSAAWDEDAQVYIITSQDVRTKEIRQVRAQVVVSAVGAFRKPMWPDIPGRESFQGISMHARMWDHSVDFSGKRVAIIGNGCSATQIVPVLSEDRTTNIVNFCRTPSWFLRRPQAIVPGWVKRMFRSVPLSGKLLRWMLAARYDIAFVNWKVGPLTSALRQRTEKACIRMIKELAPEKYHKNLIPNYPLGCKRIILDPGYLASLQRSNVELEWDPIAKLTERGIVTKSGKNFDFDIICFATGFDLQNSNTINVKGIGGKTLKEYYQEQGGPTAYMGTTTPGFPNWFTLLGPNTTTGHASVVYSEEVQINYTMQLIKPILYGDVKSFVPKPDATHAYNEYIQESLKHTVWTSCISWYREGNTREGKLVATWPATLTYMWWMMRTPIWKHYEVIGGEKWAGSRHRLSVVKNTIEALLVGAGLGVFVLVRMGKWEYARHLVAEHAGSLMAWGRSLV